MFVQTMCGTAGAPNMTKPAVKNRHLYMPGLEVMIANHLAILTSPGITVVDGRRTLSVHAIHCCLTMRRFSDHTEFLAALPSLICQTAVEHQFCSSVVFSYHPLFPMSNTQLPKSTISDIRASLPNPQSHLHEL